MPVGSTDSVGSIVTIGGRVLVGIGVAVWTADGSIVLKAFIVGDALVSKATMVAAGSAPILPLLHETNKVYTTAAIINIGREGLLIISTCFLNLDGISIQENSTLFFYLGRYHNKLAFPKRPQNSRLSEYVHLRPFNLQIVKGAALYHWPPNA